MMSTKLKMKKFLSPLKNGVTSTTNMVSYQEDIFTDLRQEKDHAHRQSSIFGLLKNKNKTAAIEKFQTQKIDSQVTAKLKEKKMWFPDLI